MHITIKPHEDKFIYVISNAFGATMTGIGIYGEPLPLPEINVASLDFSDEEDMTGPDPKNIDR